MTDFKILDVEYLETQLVTDEGMIEGPAVPILILEDNTGNSYRVGTSHETVESIKEMQMNLEEAL